MSNKFSGKQKTIPPTLHSFTFMITIPPPESIEKYIMIQIAHVNKHICCYFTRSIEIFSLTRCNIKAFIWIVECTSIWFPCNTQCLPWIDVA